MSFNESDNVESFIRDLLKSISVTFVDYYALPCQPQGGFGESHVREAVVRLNSTITVRPKHAYEVLSRLSVAKTAFSFSRQARTAGRSCYGYKGH